MAIGKKTGGRNFQPGQSGNPNGKPPLPEDIKQARALNKQEVERILNKFLTWPLEDLARFVTDKTSPVLETFVARILLEGIKKGDHIKLDFVLNRLVGKVKEEIDLNQTVNVHRHVVDIINKLNGGQNGSKEISNEKASEEEDQEK